MNTIQMKYVFTLNHLILRLNYSNLRHSLLTYIHVCLIVVFSTTTKKKKIQKEIIYIHTQIGQIHFIYEHNSCSVQTFTIGTCTIREYLTFQGKHYVRKEFKYPSKHIRSGQFQAMIQINHSLKSHRFIDVNTQ